MNAIRKSGTKERGSALVITLLLLVILTAIGIYAINLSTGEMSMAIHSRVGTSAFNAAEAGIHFGIDNISYESNPPSFSGTLSDQSSYSGSTELLLCKPSEEAGSSGEDMTCDYGVDSTGSPPSAFAGTRGIEAVVRYGPFRRP